MKKSGINTKDGFTIIEVALVLAIAGLIFLMVFVALPGLRASQRDTSRRESVMSFLDKVKRYQSNNRGALPGKADDDTISNSGGLTVEYNSDNQNTDNNTWDGFYGNYLGENFMDPSGENYKLRIVNCGAHVVDADCTSESVTGIANSGFPNDYTMVVVLQATCKGESAKRTSNPRKIAVLYKLEGAGTYCNNT